MLDFGLMVVLSKQLLHTQFNFYMYGDQNFTTYSVLTVNGSPSQSDSSASFSVVAGGELSVNNNTSQMNNTHSTMKHTSINT